MKVELFESEEKKKALITVAVVMMLVTLFLLLVSLEKPPKVAEKANEPVLIEFFETASAEAPKQELIQEQSTIHERESKAIETQAEKTIPVNTAFSTTENTSKVQPDNSFQFNASNGGGELDNQFGESEGVQERGESEHTGIASGRKVVKGPQFNSSAQIEGTIALRITVNEKGEVIKTQLAPEQSNSGSQYLIDLAKKAAKTMRFEEKPGALSEYVGVKLFMFKKM